MSGEAKTAARRARGRPTQREVAAIDGALLDIALREFVRAGYGGTTMSRIIAAAGISKTTLYSRYASKQLLFAAIVRQQIERSRAVDWLRLDAGKPDLAEGLRAFADQMLRLSLDGALLEVNRLIYSEASRFPELGAAAAANTRHGIAQVADYIALCAASDDVPCRDPMGIATAFIYMLRGWYTDVMLIDAPVSDAERRGWVDGAVAALLSGRAEW